MCVIKSLALFADVLIIGIAIFCVIKSVIYYNQYLTWEPILQYSNLSVVPLYGVILFTIAIVICLYGVIALFLNGFGMLSCYCLLLLAHSIVCLLTGFYTFVTTHEYEKTNSYTHFIDEGMNITQNPVKLEALEHMQINLGKFGINGSQHIRYYIVSQVAIIVMSDNILAILCLRITDSNKICCL